MTALSSNLNDTRIKHYIIKNYVMWSCNGHVVFTYGNVAFARMSNGYTRSVIINAILVMVWREKSWKIQKPRNSINSQSPRPGGRDPSGRDPQSKLVRATSRVGIIIIISNRRVRRPRRHVTIGLLTRWRP